MMTDDHMQGQHDCDEGTPAKQDQSEDYYHGYNIWYQHEQNMTAISEMRVTLWT